MDKEKADRIVKLISRIAEVQAAISINIFCESTENALKNKEILFRTEEDLRKLFTN